MKTFASIAVLVAAFGLGVLLAFKFSSSGKRTYLVAYIAQTRSGFQFGTLWHESPSFRSNDVAECQTWLKTNDTNAWNFTVYSVTRMDDE